MESIPALVVEPPATELEAIKQARESNEASETVVPTTFVDDAELIWSLLAEDPETEKPKNTQQEVANAMGWQRGQVAKYAQLQSIALNVWRDVIVPTFVSFGTDNADDDGTAVVPTGTATFSENLLRNILDLKPGQQLELCQKLVKGWRILVI